MSKKKHSWTNVQYISELIEKLSEKKITETDNEEWET